ncbi:helix-turn-helix domain-containing protein [Streptomyces sp. NPDC051109]|uniref:helix-turn-helix domain-containing protein n=1 Tax=Streptomyces sp. NPDC051109 TaxID=3365642 RepID=UPI003790B382
MAPAPESDRGENVERRPPASLSDQVIRYRGYRTPGARPPRVNLPSARVTLVLGWGEPLYVHDGNAAEPTADGRRSMLAGLRTTPLVAGYQGAGHAIEVEFTPMGAYRCLGLPLHHLTDAVAHPDHAMGPGWTTRTTERLAAAQDWTSRWAVVDDALAERVADRPPVSPLMTEAWNELWSSHGGMSVRELCRTTGRGSRRIQTLFRENIGIPPQTLSRIIRFQYALKLPSSRYRSLAELAAMSGYHDQAHMNRDFRNLSGHTPRQLRDLIGLRTSGTATGPDGCLSDFFGTTSLAGLKAPSTGSRPADA